MNSIKSSFIETCCPLLFVSLLFACDATGQNQIQPTSSGIARASENQQCEEGSDEPWQITSIGDFARALDEGNAVYRASQRYATAMRRRPKPYLLAHIQVEPPQDDIRVGQQAIFSVRVPFRPVGSERYAWQYGVFHIKQTGQAYTIVSSGGGEAVRDTIWSLELTAPSKDWGDHQLLFLLFGRALPGGKYDLLDSRRLYYTVSPAMAD